MNPILRFYKKTWWLWLLFVVLFIVLGIYATALFYIFIPGLLAYSLYFAGVRAKEDQEAEDRALKARESRPS